jgi:type I restriction enzyme S subunit
MFLGKGFEQVSIRAVLENAFWLMPATPQFSKNRGIPYITSKNVKNRAIDFENVKYISRKDYESISLNRPVMVGDILVSMIGTLGEIAIIDEMYEDFYGQNLYCLRLNTNLVNRRFFCEYFCSEETQQNLKSKRNQSTQAYLRANHVEDLMLPLAPIELQVRFVNFAQQVDKSKLLGQFYLIKTGQVICTK